MDSPMTGILVDSTRVTLKISKGPNLHFIADCVCSPREDWCSRGLDFELIIPYDNEAGQRRCGEITISLVPTELKRLDILDRFSFGCHRPQSFTAGMANLLKNAPFQVTNYSTKTRKGFMQVDAGTYLRLFEMLSAGVCY